MCRLLHFVSFFLIISSVENKTQVNSFEFESHAEKTYLVHGIQVRDNAIAFRFNAHTPIEQEPCVRAAQTVVIVDVVAFVAFRFLFE